MSRTIGITLGGKVTLIERRGEQEIVHDALVLAMSMDPEQAGSLGEMMIDAVWVNELALHRYKKGHDDWHRTLMHIDAVVHVSHRDWIEGRAGVAYDEVGVIAGATA